MEAMGNIYSRNALLRRYLKAKLCDKFPEIHELLDAFGRLCAEKIEPLSFLADKHKPQLIPYDPEGNRIDEIEYHPAYKEMEKIVYEYGLVWRLYEEPLATKRISGFALGYLLSQVEFGLYCPVCMTDGATYVLTRHASPELKARFVPSLLSRHREGLYQGAMFLTEKQGGSDVGLTETQAKQEGNLFRLYGQKWFCSNVDAECILTLAREEGAKPGTKGLSLFVMPKFLEKGERNYYRIDQLKDKLGTRSIPTAEVTLEGAIAFRVGKREEGFKLMTEMLNLSRLYNAVASIACMKRAFDESYNHAKKRIAFGKRIYDHPLLKRKLLEMEIEHEACFYLVFSAVQAMDQVVAYQDREQEKLLRLLTPLAKYFTAKKAILAASEAIEILGGNGYVETFITPRLLRDAQVMPIWEGTTNILVLDAFRAMAKESAQEAFFHRIEENLASVKDPQLIPFKEKALWLKEEVIAALMLVSTNFEALSFYAQDVTDAMVRLYQAAEWLALEESLFPSERHENQLSFFFALFISPLQALFQRIKEASPKEVAFS